MSKSKFNVSIIILALIMCICTAIGVSAFASEDTEGYKYTLQFSDNFDGTVSSDWAYIKGGSSYSYTANGRSVRGWRFGGENHIVYKSSGGTDYGKFLYGTASSTNYMFEVKIKVDVQEENLQQYMEENSDALGAGLTLNTTIPFFVTDPQPDTNAHEFRGREICVNNYAIGFYEKGVDADTGELNSGWVESVRLNTKFDANTFSWREWHTVRVEATEEYCRLWLDDVLLLETPQESFTRCPTARGYCGFAGVCPSDYSSIHYDDFRFWGTNENYDPDLKQDITVNSISAADFTDNSKVDYYGSSFANNMSADTANNTAVYNDTPGAEVRLLNEYSYGDFSMTVALDLENQKKTKEVGEDDTSTPNVRVSLESGLLFWADGVSGSGTNKAPDNGYMLSYMAYYTDASGNYLNRITLTLVPFVDGTAYTSISSSPYKAITIGTITGTTSCVLDISADAESQTLTVCAYKTKDDLESGTAALNKTVELSETGCTFNEGHIGMRINAGGSLNLIYEAQFLAFSARTEAAYPLMEPIAEPAAQTITATAHEHGSVQYNGASVSSFDVTTHSDVTLRFVPNEGYIVDNVQINGVDLGPKSEFILQNVTQEYVVEVTFTDVKTIDVYIIAGQSNAAGFTPVAGIYKEYTYGGTLNEEKIAEYENGYKDILYYGITQSADPASARSQFSIVRSGCGYSSDRIGPELGFAEAMSAYYGGDNGKAAVVKYAVGATSLGDVTNGTSDTYGTWMSPSMIEEYGADNLCEKAGLLYRNLLVTMRMALQDLIDAGYTPVIKGAMWMQGEADSTSQTLANLYQKHLTALISDLRGDMTEIMRELDVAQDCSAMPFVIGKIGADLQNALYEDVVREQMQRTAAAMDNVRCVETEDLLVPDANDNNDVWHFSVKGALALGNRFAEMLAQENGLKDMVTYTVSFATGDEESQAPSSQTVKQWLTAARPEEDPVRTGYTFLGWYSEGADAAFDFAARSISDDITLTARWEAVSYTIDYVLNGGEFPDANEVTRSYTIEDAVTLPTPGRTGYVFEGWFDNEEGAGEAIESISVGSTGAITLYAMWSSSEEYYTVSAEQPANGTVTISQSGSVLVGTQIDVTATPEKGYKLDAVLVNGNAIDGTSFFVTSDSVVSARFVKDETVYTVTLQPTLHGSAQLSANSAESGTEIVITVTPDEGYELDSILVNGEPITGNTFVLYEGSTVEVNFKLAVAQYTVTAEAAEHGSVSVDLTSAPENSLITVTATPDEGYELASIKVNGTEIEGNTFILTQDSIVSVEFSKAGSESNAGLIILIVAACIAAAAIAGLTVYLIRFRKKQK